MVERANAREGIIQLLREDPKIGAAEAGRVLDITRQRAHQLLEELRPEVEAMEPPPLAVGTATGEARVAVLLAAADLAARGWQVFLPTLQFPTTCDLVIVSADGERTERIEVRSAKRRLGEIQFSEPRGGAFDRIALVLSGEPVLYRPAFKNKGKT